MDVIGTVTAATGYRYGVRDSVGNRMDTLKVIDSPAGGYLGIYHTGDEVKLASSSDLLTWTFRRTLDPQATQPMILALPTGGFLTAVEYNNQAGSGGRVGPRRPRGPRPGSAGTGREQHSLRPRCRGEWIPAEARRSPGGLRSSRDPRRCA